MVLVRFMELKPRSQAAVDKGQVNTISAINKKFGKSSLCFLKRTEYMSLVALCCMTLTRLFTSCHSLLTKSSLKPACHHHKMLTLRDLQARYLDQTLKTP